MKIEGLSAIYKIENPIGEIYIGQTNNWSKRFHAYKKLKCKSQKLLYKSLKRYGWENHNIEILNYILDNTANYYEIMFIEKYKSFYKDSNLGLNLTRGGNGVKPKDRKNMSLSIYAKANLIKPVLQYNLDGSFVKEWNSYSEAARQLKKGVSGILHASRKFNRIAFGYMWKKKEVDNYPLSITPYIYNAPTAGMKFPNKEKVTDLQKKVLQYDMDGNFIKEWNGYREAARELGNYSNGISKCIIDSLKYPHYKGFQWRSYTENYPLVISKIKFKKELANSVILVHNFDGSLIMSGTLHEIMNSVGIKYEQLRVAIRDNNGINRTHKLKFSISQESKSDI